MRWSERTKKNALKAHTERYALWNEYFLLLKRETKWTFEYIAPDKDAFWDKAPEHAFKEVNFFEGEKKGDEKGDEKKPVCRFDASFGSLNQDSDLDVNVFCASPRPLEVWLGFLNSHHEGICLAHEWDTNFYYETTGEDLTSLQQSKFYAKGNIKLDFLSAYNDAESIREYTDAYRSGTALEVGGFSLYPNPDSEGFDAAAERKQYVAMSSLEGPDFAKSKSEGLLHPASLGVCGVYGEEIATALINAEEGDWKPFVAYEMLCNLRMHEANETYKTKYLERLEKALGKTNICNETTIMRRVSGIGNLDRKSEWRNIGEYITQLVKDFLDGKECNKYEEKSLDELCELMYERCRDL